MTFPHLVSCAWSWVLQPLEQRLTSGAATANEQAFIAAYGAELAAGLEHCRDFAASGGGANAEHLLQIAWEHFYGVLSQVALRPRRPPAFSGLLWPSLAFSGLLWPSLAFSGLLWPSLAFSGLLWPSPPSSSLAHSRPPRPCLTFVCLPVAGDLILPSRGLLSQLGHELQETGSLQLEQVSPKLMQAHHLELAVPGMYTSRYLTWHGMA